MIMLMLVMVGMGDGGESFASFFRAPREAYAKNLIYF